MVTSGAMFCPSCRDEFRAGFTRCATCDVELVPSLDAVGPTASPRRPPPAPASLRMVDYCGFFSLDEAREARDALRRERIRAEITIREPAGSDLTETVDEECWLRVDARQFEAAAAILGFEADSAEPAEPAACSACGAVVPEEADACPSCGAAFESD